MKKFLLLLLLAFYPLFLSAQVQPGDTAYAVGLDAGYAHNLTYGSYGNFDFSGFMPINPHFEMQAHARISTANFYTMSVQLMPKFPLPYGEMFLENRLWTRFVVRDKVNEAAATLCVGYRFQHLSVSVGTGVRVIIPTPYQWSSTEKMINEPFILTYRVEAFVRPLTSNWNIFMRASNVDEFQLERPWQPFFALGGWLDINSHWRIRLSSSCKPAGMFHLNAAYYAADVRLGGVYRF